MYLPQYTERKGSKSPENGQTERPDTLRNQQVVCSSHTTNSKKHRKLRLSVLFCCQNTETVILPAFDRQRRCCSLLRYFLRWKYSMNFCTAGVGWACFFIARPIGW